MMANEGSVGARLAKHSAAKVYRTASLRKQQITTRFIGDLKDAREFKRFQTRHHRVPIGV